MSSLVSFGTTAILSPSSLLGPPRGGLPVAYEVARELGAPLDVCVVRKIARRSSPSSESGPYRRTARSSRRSGRRRTSASGGSGAALQTLRARGAGRIVLAVPVGASDSLDQLAAIADEIVCPHPEDFFYAVGLWYDDFTTTTDDDVVALLDRARAERERSEAPSDRDVRIPLADEHLQGRGRWPPWQTRAHGARLQWGHVRRSRWTLSAERKDAPRRIDEQLQRTGYFGP